MRQQYITVTSTGNTVSSPWWQPDLVRNPVMIGLQVTSTSTGVGAAWSVDVTMDDPFGFQPNPTLNPGAPQNAAPGQIGGKNVNVFNSGLVGGWGGATITNCFGASAGPASSLPNAIGGIDQPVGGLRLTVTSSGALSETVTLTILQAGPR